jgi:hypothetical protein
MNKLVAVIVASTFALGSVSTFAANTATQPQGFGVKRTVAHNVQKASVHKVKHGKKHAKRHAKKARRAA